MAAHPPQGVLLTNRSFQPWEIQMLKIAESAVKDLKAAG